MTTRPLLLIACSQRKTAGLRRGPAWEVYDGVLYRILKKLFRERPAAAQAVEILIVSAKYGVVRPEQRLTTYELRLTPALAQRRGSFWKDGLRAAVARRRFPAVHVNLGRDYLAVLPGLSSLFRDAPIDWAAGGIGRRCAQTKRWAAERLGLRSP